MIETKQDFIEYQKEDMTLYNSLSKSERIMLWFVRDPLFEIAKYIRFLRREEFYSNTARGPLKKLLALYWFRRKNKLGNHLGFKIPKNCIGPGLTIYHHGHIIINEGAQIGKNCRLHGGNCIGNNGKDNSTAVIGDYFDCGIGACVIGDVQLGNQIRVGANAVVTKSCLENCVTLAGVPAKIICKSM